MPRSSAHSSEPAAGIWSLDGQQLALLERFDVGPAIVLVPSESVLLTIVHLPLSGRRRRLKAVPYAIENRIAEPLAAVHVALGEEVAPGHFLAGIVRHDLMQHWSAIIETAGLDRARLIPDALALPVPDAAAWSVDLAEGRALVRTGDGAGFALPAANLDDAWRMAGEPAIRSHGEPLPLSASVAELEAEPLAARLTMPALDLRQGQYAPARETASPLLRRIALVAGLGLLAHGAIAAADTLALDHLAKRRAEETRTLALHVAPGAAIGDDVASGVADLLPAAAGASQFLPLAERVATALAPLGSAVTLVDLSYDAAAGTVAIDVDARDAAGLQRVADALRSAGLDASAGATQVAGDRTSGSFLIRSHG